MYDITVDKEVYVKCNVSPGIVRKIIVEMSKRDLNPPRAKRENMIPIWVDDIRYGVTIHYLMENLSLEKVVITYVKKLRKAHPRWKDRPRNT